MLTWLHISDIHFRANQNWRDIPARATLLALLREKFNRKLIRRPDLVFCTGDIAYGNVGAGSMEQQYEQAQEFFAELLNVCELPLDRLHVVPGNHDVNRAAIDEFVQDHFVYMSKDERELDDHANKVNDLFAQPSGLQSSLTRLSEYGSFVNRCLLHQANISEKHCYARTIEINGWKVGIAGFNSAWSSGGEHDKGSLWLAATRQFNQAELDLHDANIRIGLIHHPISWLNAADERTAKSRVAKFNFWLHGHEHDSWVVPAQNCVIVTAGAVNAGSSEEFGVNIVEIDSPEQGRAHLFGYSPRENAWGKRIVSQAPEGVWPFALNLPLPMPTETKAVTEDTGRWPRIETRGEPNLSFGHIGSMHIHIDGSSPSTQQMVQELRDSHKAMGFKADLSSVISFAIGPQRKDRPQDYETHTPRVSDKEALDFFSTTLLHPGPEFPSKDRCQALCDVVNGALSALHARDSSGVVVELERVVGVVDCFGRVKAMDARGEMRSDGEEDIPSFELAFFSPQEASLLPGETPFVPNYSARRSRLYELHFALDIDWETGDGQYVGRGPFEPNQLERLSTDKTPIRVGGWFLFSDDKRWAYRSNKFETSLTSEDMRREWSALKAALDADPRFSKRSFRLRLLAEASLAVWRSPLKKKVNELTLNELAAWEGGFDVLREFWVAAPNFLGDQDPAFEEVMIDNLNGGTRYTYFLRSHVDAGRWLSFRRRLVEERMCPNAALMKAYLIEFQDRNHWTESVAFIANPRSEEKRQGVSLIVNPLNRRIRYGRLMHKADVTRFVDSLTPAMTGGQIATWEPVKEKGTDCKIAMSCIHLASRIDGAILDELDGKLVFEASIYDGDIAHYGSRSILVAFCGDSSETVSQAFQFSLNMIRFALSSAWHGPSFRIVVNYGSAKRVHRACGLRWEGEAIRGCTSMLQDNVSKLEMLVTEAAREACGASDAWVALESAEPSDAANGERPAYRVKLTD